MLVARRGRGWLEARSLCFAMYGQSSTDSGVLRPLLGWAGRLASRRGRRSHRAREEVVQFQTVIRATSHREVALDPGVRKKRSS